MSLVKIKNLTRHYQQGEFTVKALDGVSVDIKKGEFTALMGASGSGKTTLLNLIGGLDAPSSGSLTVNGVDLAKISASERSDMRRERLGFVFQAYNLIPVLTAAENAEFVMMLQGVDKDERRKKALEALEAVGLKGMGDRFPNQLSGGQQQRVAIARAIAPNPSVVLADEPTANLDSKTSHNFIELMRTLNRERGVTFIFATHDPKLMNAVDRVIELQDGKIISDTTR